MGDLVILDSGVRASAINGIDWSAIERKAGEQLLYCLHIRAGHAKAKRHESNLVLGC
jgi:hypothetical protein